MTRRLVWALALLALLAAVWLIRPGPDDETLVGETHREAEATAADAGDSPGEVLVTPAEAEPEASPAPAAPAESAPTVAGTDIATEPVTHHLDTLPFEQKKGDGFVKIGFDDRGRVEVEAECVPERVFTFDVHATLDGELEWLAGSDGVATLRANLANGNRKYLTQRHWSRLRASLATHGVESGADVEVRITWFDLEGRKLEEERYRFSAP